jgi:hypothetical protein
MASEHVMHLRAKGSEAALARLKSDIWSHCTVMDTNDPPIPSAVDYSVDLAAWNPNREDWREERLHWWLELRRGESELLPIENGELKAVVGSRGVPALHFLDGLRELYPDVELSGYAINLSGESAENWKCSPEGTFCIEEVFPCWGGEIVSYWKKLDRLMIEGGKPIAEELLGFAGNPFVLVDGVPLSITLDAAKEYVWKQAEANPYFLTRLLCEWPSADHDKYPSGKDENRAPSAMNDFFFELNKLYFAQMVQKDASWHELRETTRDHFLDVIAGKYPWLADKCRQQKSVSDKS